MGIVVTMFMMLMVYEVFVMGGGFFVVFVLVDDVSITADVRCKQFLATRPYRAPRLSFTNLSWC